MSTRLLAYCHKIHCLVIRNKSRNISKCLGVRAIYSQSKFPHFNVNRQPAPFISNQFESKVHWTVYNMASPGNHMRWDLTPEDIDKGVEKLIKQSTLVHEAVGSLKPDEVTYQNVIEALAFESTDYNTQRNLLDFYQHVFPNKDLREASVKADKKLSDFDVEISMRQDVFDNLLAIQTQLGDTLTGETKRFLERRIKYGKRNGLHLTSDLQEKIKVIKKRMSSLSIDFSKNLNEENTTVEFTEEELVGLPENFIKNLDKTETGKCKLTLKYPHYFPCMKFARNPETRKKLEIQFNSRCMTENTPILGELIELRQQEADLLNFPTHAAYVLDMRMAKSPDRVSEFLKDLTVKLQPLKDEEMKLFLQYKEEECKKHGYEFDNKINMWDFRYYMTRTKKKKVPTATLR